MKRFLPPCLLLLILLGSTSAAAADKVNALIVQLKNGTQTKFILNEKPQISFAGTNLKVVSEKSETSFPMADVLRFTYDKEDVNGINEQVEDPAGISFEDGMLIVSQIKKGADVCIYTTDGKLQKKLTAQRTGTYRLSLSLLSKGVYLIKADNVTYKITKR